MQDAAIFIPDNDPRDSEYAHDCVEFIRRRGDVFVALILRDWDHVDHCLRTGFISTVVVARTEHRAAGRPVEVATPLASVASLDRQRSQTTTRRIDCRTYAGRHRDGAAAVGSARVPFRTAEQRIEDATRRWKAWRPSARPTL